MTIREMIIELRKIAISFDDWEIPVWISSTNVSGEITQVMHQVDVNGKLAVILDDYVSNHTDKT